jgi:hypothetical protein
VAAVVAALVACSFPGRVAELAATQSETLALRERLASQEAAIGRRPLVAAASAKARALGFDCSGLGPLRLHRRRADAPCGRPATPGRPARRSKG